MAVREQVYGYFIPSVTLIGIGASKQIPDKIKALGGSKPLIVTDKGITGAGITKQITDLLDAAKMKYVVYDETIPNPTDKNVHDGVDVYKKEKCDSLITLGGGSSHDCGKGVGLVIANGGKIHDYRRRRQILQAHAALPGGQHHRGHRFRDDPFLHHHRHLPSREDGHC